MKTALYGTDGKKKSDIELKEQVFGQKINEGLMHQVVRAEMASTRRGTASTKTRAQVRGGGIKPWRQKGTGRARAGSIRSPLFVGGGTTFGPKPRDYEYKVPKKMAKAALRSALSAKAKDKEIMIVEKIDLKEKKTKKAKEILDKLKVNKESTILVEKADENIVKSFRNLENVNVLSFDKISPYSILANKVLIITKDALNKLVEVLS